MKNSIRLALLLFPAFLFIQCDVALDEGDYHTLIDASHPGNIGVYDISGEGYNTIAESAFVLVADEPVSTFSIDADGGSYSNVRRLLEDGIVPPQGAIRTEEFINYFQYDYKEPDPGLPISLEGEISACPWTEGNQLVRISLKGKHIPREEMPPANFVFLIDVSGSMSSSNKLELLKDGFIMYADFMRPQDKIAIVTYAGEAGVLLNSTPGDEKSTIKNAVAKLGAGGSTNGAGGIHKAYEIAEKEFIPRGNNRVILGTDGDFNVGVNDQQGLIDLIEEKRETGVFISALGVGAGNYQDAILEQLADNGNGTYEYIDDLEQARKVFVEEFGKFYTVAKDVKIQVEFDSNAVYQYRLIGYENRILDSEDFEDDTRDAGEIGADQSITAFYEITPKSGFLRTVPSLNIDFRYKEPEAENSVPLSLDIYDEDIAFDQASENLRFGATAAGFGMLLWGSEYSGDLSWQNLLDWSNDARTFDPEGYRTEFRELVITARSLVE